MGLGLRSGLRLTWWRGRPTMDGKTARGASSPAKPAFTSPEPLSHTRAVVSSSSHILAQLRRGLRGEQSKAAQVQRLRSRPGPLPRGGDRAEGGPRTGVGGRGAGHLPSPGAEKVRRSCGAGGRAGSAASRRPSAPGQKGQSCPRRSSPASTRAPFHELGPHYGLIQPHPRPGPGGGKRARGSPSASPPPVNIETQGKRA